MKDNAPAGPLAERRLRPYQREIAIAVLESVLHGRGLTFSVEIARQGGKNELSAQLELLLLVLNMAHPRNLVKCSPTFRPQAVISMLRLKDRLNEAGFSGIWMPELGYAVRLGHARALFLSAADTANVVGNTAHILLEVDEAQDVGKEKFTKEFKPMGASTNVTTVLYGTTWDETTLLHETRETNLELERHDGLKRHFRYDWEAVAASNPRYADYVAGERTRLGEEHPLFRTQYRLLPLRGGGGFLNMQQRARLAGEHPRERRHQAGRIYVAGIDIAGEAEAGDDEMQRTSRPRQDSTVVTIAELDYSACDDIIRQPRIKVVEHYRWTGRRHTELYAGLLDIIKEVWRCRVVVVDATGIGEPVCSFFKAALGRRVVPFTFSAKSKSELGFNLLAAVNSGRLKVYRPDGSAEAAEFWQEMELARSVFRPNQTMNFFVDTGRGHDDFLMSLALVVEAGRRYSPRQAQGRDSTP